MKNHLLLSKVGIHTMLDEHFGISIAEMLFSGVIPVCHNSGGPLYDFRECGAKLANTEDEFVENIITLLTLNDEEFQNLSISAIKEVKRKFGRDKFIEPISRLIKILNKF
jgi:alpha-1,2-mannosyltransferase